MGLIQDLHHASLIVSDTARALQFYVDVLGMAQDGARPDLGYPGAWLEVGDRQLHLLQLPNPDSVENRPLHGGRDRHLAFAVSGLDAFIARLEQAAPCTRPRSSQTLRAKSRHACRSPPTTNCRWCSSARGRASSQQTTPPCRISPPSR